MSPRPPEDQPEDRAPDGETPDDDLGTVAEEAAKLLGALAGWAGDQGTDWGRGVAGAAGAAAGSAAELASHLQEGLRDGLAENLATGAPECRWCPVCRTVHAVRELSPEVRAHLTSAASSLIAAAAGILATAVPPDADARTRGTSGSSAAGTGRVERIDLDDEPWPEEDQ